jgi:hypothetical protein
MLGPVKRLLLPDKDEPRKLRFGLGKGARMNINLRTHVRYYLGIYEYALNKHLKKMLRPGIVCYDIGGNFGYDAIVLAQRTKGTVISFERQDVHVHDITENAKLNPGLKIEVVRAFVGGQDQEGFVRIDTIAKRGPLPDFMKMDIEGAEVEALQGAEWVLSTRKPDILIEVHGMDKEQGCLEILRRHGYEPIIVNYNRIWGEARDPAVHNRWIVAYGKPSAA